MTSSGITAEIKSKLPVVDVVGEMHQVRLNGRTLDAIPLPHPSGASTWHRTSPGQELLERALERVGEHPAFREILA